ncbi:hypothetical protein HPP92_026220 [Vanilla planifolia]|uniref:Uncharacterized protein n=1 Tax=Vanilla planifolia TaxID=51239 RepID=A0A835PJP7_VANPL|nr:hypothetical protein HPP92_026400 [Vanilla planifolia]KAG0451527.1 hypothetical protein HPP92_026220 [Vanilla planifolia]
MRDRSSGRLFAGNFLRMKREGVASVPPPLEWKFFQVFKEATGEEVQKVCPSRGFLRGLDVVIEFEQQVTQDGEDGGQVIDDMVEEVDEDGGND